VVKKEEIFIYLNNSENTNRSLFSRMLQNYYIQLSWMYLRSFFLSIGGFRFWKSANSSLPIFLIIQWMLYFLIFLLC